MVERIIFHIDVNSAFLSWSAVNKLKDDPSAVDLRTIPSAVGGDTATRHGIITAKSIPAKKYGIVTGEPVVKAMQKCPGLVMVKGDFNTYHEYSKAFINILLSYTPDVEQVSIDEAFLDMTSVMQLWDGQRGDASEAVSKAVALAEKIKDEIRDTLGFTVNVGISSNKLLAKMASDFQKPDRIHTLFPEEISDKMWPLSIDSLYGCGKATAARLHDIGIMTIGECAAADEKLLCDILGEKSGEYIWKSANGISTSPVKAEQEKAKGYSNETTTTEDIDADSYEKRAIPIIHELADSVASRLRKDGVFAQTIGLSVKTSDFKRHSRQCKLSDSTNTTAIIFETAVSLSRELLLGSSGLFVRGYGVRLIGVSATSLDHGEFRQMSLFNMHEACDSSVSGEHRADISYGRPEPASDKNRKLDEMTDKIRKRYGKKAITIGKRS